MNELRRNNINGVTLHVNTHKLMLESSSFVVTAHIITMLIMCVWRVSVIQCLFVNTLSTVPGNSECTYASTASV